MCSISFDVHNSRDGNLLRVSVSMVIIHRGIDRAPFHRDRKEIRGHAFHHSSSPFDKYERRALFTNLISNEDIF